MWRTCGRDDCDEQFYLSGSYQIHRNHRLPLCPKCKANRRRYTQKAIDEWREKGHPASTKEHHTPKDPPRRVWDKWGRLVSREINEPKDCEFCGCEFTPKRHNSKYCPSCNEDRTKQGGYRKYHADCEVCGKAFWKAKSSTATWCSDSCKQLLREHTHCLFCDDEIEASRPLNTKFCKANKPQPDDKAMSCKARYQKAENFNSGKVDYIFTPIRKFEIMKEMGAGYKLLEEFYRKIPEDQRGEVER